MAKSIASKPAFRWVDAVFVAALVAHIPLGLEYARRMWRVGHYQFFPLLMLVAGWLLYGRVSQLTAVRQQSNTVFGLLAANILLLSVAVVSFSPFLWIISFLLLLAIFVYDEWGKRGLIAGLPAMLLMLFVIPLPGNLDLKLINQMQFLASQLASWVLDAFGQMHFREGVVLVTEKKQFFTEEACSGIRSLFSSLAAISIYGVMQRYPAWRHAFNVIQTIIWVIVGNALRIAIVVYVSDNWTESIASGTNHEMLGLVVFLFIFALAMSTDRALNAWQTETKNRSLENLVDEVEEPVVEGKKVPQSRPGVSRPGSPAIKWTLVGLFALLALFALRLTWVKTAGDMLQFNKSMDLLSTSESDLPASIQGWKVTSFDHQMRDDIRLLAPESYLWTFEKGGRQVKVSLDSPYYDFHNLNDCYAGFGWDVDYEHDYDLDGQTQSKNMTVLNMQKKNEEGLVMFTAYDRNGNLAVPRNDVNLAPSGWKKMIRNVRQALGLLTQENDPRMSKQPLPISQVQMIYRTSGKVGDTKELESLFFEVRKILSNSKRFRENSGS